eukprot:TRINITY_DN996_c0_g1_i1.p1 TRINITY_DN996_c0_g1~~TRINITY_DN996_c0_g1_i1.p1  ORF type:complete len:1177 (-),score=425.73 TRINITY_DN996_c0_g1_i1:3286-6816(-)
MDNNGQMSPYEANDRKMGKQNPGNMDAGGQNNTGWKFSAEDFQLEQSNGTASFGQDGMVFEQTGFSPSHSMGESVFSDMGSQSTLPETELDVFGQQWSDQGGNNTTFFNDTSSTNPLLQPTYGAGQDFDLGLDTKDLLEVAQNAASYNGSPSYSPNSSVAPGSPHSSQGSMGTKGTMNSDAMDYSFSVSGQNQFPRTMSSTSTSTSSSSSSSTSSSSLSSNAYTLSLHGAPDKARTDKQNKICIQLTNSRGGKVQDFRWMKMPSHLLKKRQGSAKKEAAKLDQVRKSDPSQIVEAEVCVVGHDDPSETPVERCFSCVQREQKADARAARKRKGNSSEPEFTVEQEQRRFLVCYADDYVDFSSGEIIIPMRMTCYCRHHNETTGFLVKMTIRDNDGNVLGVGYSSPIMITDDHKMGKKGTKRRRTTTTGDSVAGSEELDDKWVQSAKTQSPEMEKVTPAQGPIQGGVEIVVIGRNFVPGTTVIFGVNESTTQFWSETTLVCTLPPSAITGPVPLAVELPPAIQDLLTSSSSSRRKRTNTNNLVFTYTDDNAEKKLMELALRLVGMSLTGQTRDARDIAQAIISSNSNNQGFGGGGGSGSNDGMVFEQVDGESHLESLVMNALIWVSQDPQAKFNWQIDLGNKAGQTILHLAAVCGFTRLADMLLTRFNADPSIRDINGYNCLHFAAMYGHHEMVRSMLTQSRKRSPNKPLINSQTDENGYTALHLAATGRFDAVIRTLIQFKCNRSLQDDFGFLAYEYYQASAFDGVGFPNTANAESTWIRDLLVPTIKPASLGESSTATIKPALTKKRSIVLDKDSSVTIDVTDMGDSSDYEDIGSHFDEVHLVRKVPSPHMQHTTGIEERHKKRGGLRNFFDLDSDTETPVIDDLEKQKQKVGAQQFAISDYDVEGKHRSAARSATGLTLFGWSWKYWVMVSIALLGLAWGIGGTHGMIGTVSVQSASPGGESTTVFNSPLETESVSGSGPDDGQRMASSQNEEDATLDDDENHDEFTAPEDDDGTVRPNRQHFKQMTNDDESAEATTGKKAPSSKSTPSSSKNGRARSGKKQQGQTQQQKLKSKKKAATPSILDKREKKKDNKKENKKSEETISEHKSSVESWGPRMAAIMVSLVSCAFISLRHRREMMRVQSSSDTLFYAGVFAGLLVQYVVWSFLFTFLSNL